MRSCVMVVSGIVLSLAGFSDARAAAKKPQHFSPPGVDLRQPIIWGAEATNPDGFALAFGGNEQAADDGNPHTRIKKAGEWTRIVDDLRKANATQPHADRASAIRTQVKNALASARHAFFQGCPPALADALAKQTAPELKKAADDLAALVKDLRAFSTPDRERLDANGHRRVEKAAELLEAARKQTADAAAAVEKAVSPETIAALWDAQVAIETAAEILDAEPGPRALSPIVWEPKNKVFVLFGGDHLDFLRSDLWTFDPATTRWELRMTAAAPPPRANHKLEATGDGKIKLTGGYTYFDDVWYMGPFCQLHNDGEWVFDLAKNEWASAAGEKGVPPESRTYRTGLFHPMTYVKGPAPDAAATAKTLDALPANTWVAMNPPLKPKMNRDWGSACIDTARDVMLRWSGGHCAHGGSDVISYHFATNRWELPFPVEFPLGQTYSNTSYPGGFNFNRRPWVSGHTYKCFGYDPPGGTMLFLGHNPWNYIFDPRVSDWTGRTQKPAGMNYGSSFYTLTCVSTDAGLACWSGDRKVYRYDAKAGQWAEIKAQGQLPGPSVDHCGIAWDSKRDRFLLFPTAYGKPFSGAIVALDVKTGAVTNLEPAGIETAAKLPGFLRENVYLPDADAVLIVGATLPPAGGDALRPSLAYDCAKNAWVAMKIAGPHPAGGGGRNVSLGSGYDPKRKLIWATDTGSQVYVLRPDLEKAERVE